MKVKQRWLLNVAQVVLILLGLAFFLVSSGKIFTNLGWPFPWWFSILFFIAGGICGFYALKLSDEAEKQRALAHMAGRPAFNNEEFGKHYFQNDRAEVAAKLREILSHHIPVDLSQMKPTDLFVEDLRMDALDSLSTVEYVIAIEKEFGIKMPDSAAEKMLTFQSVVDYVAEAVKNKST